MELWVLWKFNRKYSSIVCKCCLLKIGVLYLLTIAVQIEWCYLLKIAVLLAYEYCLLVIALPIITNICGQLKIAGKCYLLMIVQSYIIHWHDWWLKYGALQVHSYYTAIALRYQYIDNISVASHRSITSFHVKRNLTSCDTAQCSIIAWVYSVATQRRCSMNRPSQY